MIPQLLALSGILDNTTFVLFAILALGLALGNIKVWGISLGSSGVLFVALAAGHFGLKIPAGIGGLSTALFVYCVGLGVGNRFFSSLRSRGNKLVLLSIVVVSLAAVTTIVLSRWAGVDGSTAAGMFAGACTSTPGFAAALESAQNAIGVNIGYGVAYPFGVVGVVLFVQVLPRLLKRDISKDENAGSANPGGEIVSRMIVVRNPAVVGKWINGSDVRLKCRVTRKVRDGNLRALEPGDAFAADTEYRIVGRRDDVEREVTLLGEFSDNHYPFFNSEEKCQVIVTKDDLCGQTLSELDTLARYGVTISRISRLGNSFVPNQDTEIVRNDVLTAIGAPEQIEAFKAVAGHRSTSLNATDIFSLTAGLALGILIGNIKFGMGDGEGFSLGMAGGPLIVALILGHFGKIGPLVGYIPRPTRVLLMELGLMLFLAWAGVAGGEKLVETLQAQGLTMFLVGVGITLIPMLFGWFFAVKVLKLDLLETLGGICGAMTSTPALGAITGKTDAQSPVISYATAYPAALILMTLYAKVILSFMGA